mgnify:FL=1
MSTKFGRAFLAFFVALSFGTAAYADEGLWTFDNFPVQTVKDKYGVTIDQGWRDHVRAAAVRLSVGCSASVVSAKGLVMTNHHCAASCLQDLSKPGADYITDGFSAKTPENEKPCPGMQAEILLSSSEIGRAHV